MKKIMKKIAITCLLLLIILVGIVTIKTNIKRDNPSKEELSQILINNRDTFMKICEYTFQSDVGIRIYITGTEIISNDDAYEGQIDDELELVFNELGCKSIVEDGDKTVLFSFSRNSDWIGYSLLDS